MTREPEWDDAQREMMQALDLYESGVCQCGFHSSLTEDKRNLFSFETKVCNVCAASDKWHRIQAEADEKAAKAMGDSPPPASPRPGDGRRTLIRQLSDGEAAERKQSRPLRAHERGGDLQQGDHAKQSTKRKKTTANR